MKNPEKLIGRKVLGFKFEGNNIIFYDDEMDRNICEEGIIKKYNDCNKSFAVEFKNVYWAYPADQIEAHLVEDEIPTLSDGVMMLVSDNEERWHKRKVIGKRGIKTIAWYDDQLVYWSFCKPLEPTKEEQLTAILGSDEKVSEIMELFKK